MPDALPGVNILHVAPDFAMLPGRKTRAENFAPACGPPFQYGPANSDGCPSPAQIALGLIVIKSKPTGLSLEDYFGQLRRHVQDRPRRKSAEEHEHLDSIAFWKQAYETSEAAQAELLDRIYELEQTQTLPRKGLTILDMPATPPVMNKRKRKNESMTKANSQSKRRAVMAKMPQLQENMSEEPADPEIAVEVDESAAGSVAFMRHLFNLRQQIALKRPETRPLQHAIEELCRIAVVLLSNGSAAVLPLVSIEKANTPTPTTNIRSTVLAIQRSYHSTLLGLDKLCATSESTSQVGSVVYEVTVLFETALAKISTLMVQQAGKMGEPKPKAKTSKAKSRTSKQSHDPSSEDHHAICQSLAQLAVTMLTALDTSKISHSQILEGCLCVFFDHLGSSLSLAVFTENPPSRQRGMFTGVLPPQGLQDMSTFDSETALRAVQLVAPYLIYILDHVMTLITSYEDLDRSQPTTLFSLFKDSRTSKSTFVARIKEKLQNSLLKGVFGDDGETFCNALRIPERPAHGIDEDSPVKIGPAEQTLEWFTGEIWRTLGWRILTSDDASF